MKKIFSLFAAVLFAGSMMADESATIAFGTNDVKINAASVTGDDSQGNTWTITTVGTTSFTTNPSYYQVGASKSPATSITFTTTLADNVSITAFSAKFGGFSGTAGDVTLKVGDTSVGTGSLNGTSDVTVSATTVPTEGKVLTVTVTGISKGVKVYNISYSYSTNASPLKSLAISGDLTKKAYEEGEELDYSGLTVTGTYEDESKEDLTSSIEWSYTPELAVGVTSVTVTATKGEITANKVIEGLTVTEHVVTPDEYTVDFNAALFGTSAGNNITEEEATATKNDITFVIGATSGTKPRTDAGFVRLYTNNYLTVSVPAGYVLSSIEFVEPETDNNWGGLITVDKGTYDADAKSWSGDENEVTFSFGAQNRIASVVVTFAKDVPAAVATPAFSVEQGSYAEAQSVELSCETEGAKIYYTLDGTDPTAESTEYTAAIVLEERGSYTIKAIAIKGEEKSKVAAATYVINLPYTLVELVAADLTANTVVNVVLKDEVIKDFYMYKNAIAGVIFDVQKDGADVKIYFNNTTTISDWKKGGTLSGTLLNATWTTYNEEWQIKPGTGFKWADLEYTAPSATAIDNTAFEAKTFKTFENGQLVIIKNGIKYNATGAVIR